MVTFDTAAILNVTFSVALVALSLVLAVASLRRHLPYSLVAAIFGGALMALTLLFSALGPAGLGFDGLRLVTLVLRISAVLVLMAATWTFLETSEERLR